MECATAWDVKLLIVPMLEKTEEVIEAPWLRNSMSEKRQRVYVADSIRHGSAGQVESSGATRNTWSPS